MVELSLAQDVLESITTRGTTVFGYWRDVVYELAKQAYAGNAHAKLALPLVEQVHSTHVERAYK